MSLRSPRNYQIPEETVRVATAAFPKGSLYMDMHAELGLIYTNAQFASLFSSTGQPADDPARLALIWSCNFSKVSLTATLLMLYVAGSIGSTP